MRAMPAACALLFLLSSVAILPAKSIQVLPPPPQYTEGCHIIKASSLSSWMVSSSYGDSVWGEIKTILYEYLGKGKMSREQFFHEYAPSDAPYPPGTFLDLCGTIVRTGDQVAVTVTVTDSETGSTVLDSRSSTCFFAPSAALRAFADSVSTDFALPLANPGYRYDPPNVGFTLRGDTIVMDCVPYECDGFVLNYWDLVYDLHNTAGAPRKLFEEISSYSARGSFAAIGGLVGCGLFIGGGLGYLASFDDTYGQTSRGDRTLLGAAALTGAGLLGLTLLIMEDSPRVDSPGKIRSMLEAWAPGPCR